MCVLKCNHQDESTTDHYSLQLSLRPFHWTVLQYVSSLQVRDMCCVLTDTWRPQSLKDKSSDILYFPLVVPNYQGAALFYWQAPNLASNTHTVVYLDLITYVTLLPQILPWISPMLRTVPNKCTISSCMFDKQRAAVFGNYKTRWGVFKAGQKALIDTLTCWSYWSSCCSQFVDNKKNWKIYKHANHIEYSVTCKICYRCPQ